MAVKLNRNFVPTLRVIYQFVEINSDDCEEMLIDFDFSQANAERQYDESSAKKKYIERTTTWQNVKTRKKCQVTDTKHFKQNF